MQDLEVGEKVITRVVSDVPEMLQDREAVIYSIEGPDIRVKMLDDGGLQLFASGELERI